MIPETTSSFTRRRFLATGAAAVSLAPFIRLNARDGSPNDEVLMGFIGVGGQGRSNMTNFLNIEGVRVVAVCDTDAGQANHARDIVNGHYDNQDCKVYRTYDELLAHSGLDAVGIATPDHSHAQIGIAAANAGIDIYGEKPFAWGLAEGRQLVEALKKNQRVWQTGSWQRSTEHFRRFKALIDNNTLGKLSRLECGTPAGVQQGGVPENWQELIGKAPDHLDWNGWCHPVKDFEYHPMLHPWNWRWNHTFGGGNLMDWVGHHVDCALWALGLDDTGPVLVEGSGDAIDHPFFDAYERYSYKGTFADGRTLEVVNEHFGCRFTGENGWIMVNRGTLEASDREMLRNVPEDFETRPPSHYQNFIDCVRSRELTVAHAEAGHRSGSFGQLALVAIDSGKPVKWDPEAEKVIDDSELANHPRLGSRVTG